MTPLSSSSSPNPDAAEIPVVAPKATVPDLPAFQEIGVFAFFLAVYCFLRMKTAPMIDDPRSASWALLPITFLLIASGLYAFTARPMMLYSNKAFKRTVLWFSLGAVFCMVGLARWFGGGMLYPLHLIFLVPVAEESFFRGVFLDHLVRYNGKSLAVVLSSALFALMHLTQGAFVQMLVLGLILGILAVTTRRLAFPILGHMAWNIAALML